MRKIKKAAFWTVLGVFSEAWAVDSPLPEDQPGSIPSEAPQASQALLHETACPAAEGDTRGEAESCQVQAACHPKIKGYHPQAHHVRYAFKKAWKHEGGHFNEHLHSLCLPPTSIRTQGGHERYLNLNSRSQSRFSTVEKKRDLVLRESNHFTLKGHLSSPDLIKKFPRGGKVKALSIQLFFKDILGLLKKDNTASGAALKAARKEVRAGWRRLREDKVDHFSYEADEMRAPLTERVLIQAFINSHPLKTLSVKQYGGGGLEWGGGGRSIHDFLPRALNRWKVHPQKDLWKISLTGEVNPDAIHLIDKYAPNVKEIEFLRGGALISGCLKALVQSSFPRLTDMVMENDECDWRGLGKVSWFVHLKSLSLRGTRKAPYLSGVHLPQLERLKLGGGMHSVKNLTMPRAPGLKVLQLSCWSEVNENFSEALQNLPAELKILELEGVGQRGEEEFCIFPRQKADLCALGLINCALDDEKIEAFFRDCDVFGFKALNLADNCISAKGLKKVFGQKWFPRLEKLDLRGNFLSPSSLKMLAGYGHRLPHLKEIDFRLQQKDGREAWGEGESCKSEDWDVVQEDGLWRQEAKDQYRAVLETAWPGVRVFLEGDEDC